ncbi:MAG: glycosyltransferase [Rhodocyclaceae bacterium]|nr:glycosyltransferase [Rhodocyclaceae bacterium]
MTSEAGGAGDVPRADVLVVGPLANVDLALAEALSRNGLRCLVVRSARAGMPDPAAPPIPLRHLTSDRILANRGHLWFLARCRRVRFIVSATGSLLGFLGPLWFLRRWLGIPPHMNITTGADITEMALEGSLKGFLFRRLLRAAAFNWIPTTTHALAALRRLRLTNVAFMRFPMPLRGMADAAGPAGPVTYLHCSHLDWGLTDNKAGRNSTKGNDRFFRAFARAVADGADIRCIVLDRGPDRIAAREALRRSGCEQRIEWRPATDQAGLARMFAEADVVVDQFDAGFFGWTAWEAMSQAKAVLIHLDPECVDLLYDGAPPVLSCRSEEEILRQIMDHQDREALRALGDAARTWVWRNHGSDADMAEFVFRICVASGLEPPGRATAVAGR